MTTTPVALERNHRAVLVLFAFSGAAFASWAARIPTFKAALGLDARQLGLLLLAASAGSLTGLPFAGRLAHRLGTVRTVGLACVLVAAAITGLGVTAQLWPRPGPMAVALFLTGLGVGLWDVTMNLEGAQVERELGRSVMPHYHAAFSAGTVVAALLASGLIALSAPTAAHLAGVALVSVLCVGAALRSCGTTRPVAQADGSPGNAARSAWTEPRTLLVGVVTMVAAFTEGTANDWLSVAFVEGHGVPGWAGVLAFAVFLSAMTAGRLLGTRLLDRHGRVPVLRVMLALAVAGLLLVVLGSPVVAYLGAAAWGLGVALGFPVGMSAAADDPARAHARISVVSTIGYSAFVAGPPLLGLLGHRVGVLRALLVVGVAVLVALVCLPAVREPDSGDFLPRRR